jgi:gamma-glutamyl hydrolase
VDFSIIVSLCSDVSHFQAGGSDVLSDFDSEDLSLSLSLTSAAAESRLLGATTTPPDVLEALTGGAGVNVTTNWHMYGVGWPEPFSTSVALPSGMVALSTNADREGLEFVSTMEHETLPIYATQWHPEANQVGGCCAVLCSAFCTPWNT